jgi:UDP-N-acetyl-2-amino-2-deoxyglucuronate dehydrogenase
VEKRPLGIGLIGCGDIAPTHAKALAQAADARLAACMDVVEPSAKSLAEEYGVPYTTTVEDLLARPEVEAVTLATPAYTHADLTEAAAKAGKAVLCEKPLASDLPDADRMIAACEKAGVALATCFPLRYLGAAEWIRQLTRAAALGDVISVRMRVFGEKKDSYWTGGFSGRTQTEWRKSKALSGGGIIITNLIHHIDLARALTGLDVKSAFAEAGVFATRVEVEDLAAACLRYENDAIGVVEGASCAWGGSDERQMNLLYTKGQVRFSLWGGNAEVFLMEGADGLPAREWVKREFEDATHARLYDEFAAAVRAGEAPPITGEDGRKALEVVLGIYRSAETGRPVSLPL